jgi:hypothetical protein
MRLEWVFCVSFLVANGLCASCFVSGHAGAVDCAVD